MGAFKHWEILVEEPSMEAFLHALLPRVMPEGYSYSVHSFQGKPDLLGTLEARLRAYARWLPADWRVIVIVDRDDEDCRALKARLENIGVRAGLLTRSRARTTGQRDWVLANRIVIEELEAWYFGDWSAVQRAFPRVPGTVPRNSALRDSDAIKGGTWQAFERVLRRHGYARQGLAKIETARVIGQHFLPDRCRSQSFRVFFEAMAEAWT